MTKAQHCWLGIVVHGWYWTKFERLRYVDMPYVRIAKVLAVSSCTGERQVVVRKKGSMIPKLVPMDALIAPANILRVRFRKALRVVWMWIRRVI